MYVYASSIQACLWNSAYNISACMYVCMQITTSMVLYVSDRVRSCSGCWRIELSNQRFVEVPHVNHDAVVVHHRPVELLRRQVRTFP